MEHETNWILVWSLVALVILILVAIWMWIWPTYNVWASAMKGKADLEQAHYEQEIAVAQAKSRLNAAEMNKKAAIVEAEAVSEQIRKIGENLSKHDLYLKWQWIKMMEERDGETIYVPTEAGLPILEATRKM